MKNVTQDIRVMKESNGDFTFILDLVKESGERLQQEWGKNDVGLKPVVYKMIEVSRFFGIEEIEPEFMFEGGAVTKERYQEIYDEVLDLLDD